MSILCSTQYPRSGENINISIENLNLKKKTDNLNNEIRFPIIQHNDDPRLDHPNVDILLQFPCDFIIDTFKLMLNGKKILVFSKNLK